MDWDEFREKEENDYLIQFLKQRQKAWENQVLADLEESLAKTSGPRVPAPNTAHPSLERYAQFVRALDSNHVRIPRPVSLNLRFYEATHPESPLEPPIVLSRVLAVARMPFVGDPLTEDWRYTWWVWRDDYGRHISSDTKINIGKVQR